MTNSSFWEKLKKPFFVLAPMADVTDAAFRRVIAKYGKPDVMYTEFVSCDGLCSAGRENLIKDLVYDKSERPIVAQVFGANPENFYKCAKLIKELGFDGIDINMGCPDKNIQKQKAGAYLMKTPKLAQEIILATKEGAESGRLKIPVSVKTRIGYTENQIEEWLPAILETRPNVITIHGRTKKEMSKVDTHWDVIGRAAEIARGSGILIVGNGDIKSMEEAREKAKKYGLDGIMVGRGVFGNPWFFNRRKKTISIREKMEVLCEHTFLFEELVKQKRFDLMKKHFKAYVSGFDGVKELRIKLMEAENGKEVETIIKSYIKKV